MNTLIQWNPFRELDELQNRLGSFLGRFPNRTSTGLSDTEKLALPDWSPPVDIIEDDHEYLVKADLPEVRREDVNVMVENGIVSVFGKRRDEKEEKNRKYHRIERSYGTFRRGFLVPEDADPTKVKAEFKDGVLQIHMPKTSAPKPNFVEVKIN